MDNEGVTYSSMSDAISKYENNRRLIILAIVIGVIGLACFFLPFITAACFFMPFITIACMIVAVILGLKSYLKCKKLYKELFVKGALEKNFQNVFYNPDWGFSKDDVKKFNLVKMGSDFSSEDYIKASYNGINFELSDVYVADTTSDGENSSTTIFFKGRMIIFNLSDKKVSYLRMFSNNFRYSAVRRKDKPNKVDLESVEFNKEFSVYSENAHDVFYLLTPQYMERIQSLNARYKSIAINIWDNRVIFAFNEPKNDAFDASSVLKKIDYQNELAKIQADIDDIKVIINALVNQDVANDMQQSAYDGIY